MNRISKLLLPVVLLLFGTVSLSAQKTFLLKNASKLFDVKIHIAKCESDVCEGKGTVYLLKKNQTQVFQTIEMPQMYLELGSDKKPTANLIELYGENNSGVNFEDYNFDGAVDLALRNGNDGAYNGPSYDVFLFSKTAKKFVRNHSLTKLASENLGLFTANKNDKTIETFNKSGCCWHETIRYKFLNNRLRKVYVLTEDASRGDEWVRITTKSLAGGRWKTTVRTAPVEEYYKEQ